MCLFCQWMQSVTSILLSLALFQSSAFAAEPDQPLVFSLRSETGLTACLVAINHMVLRAAEESSDIVGCEQRARALVFEAAPLPKEGYSLAKYVRGNGDPAIQDLSDATVRKIVPALKSALYSPEQIKQLLALHPVAVYRALIYSKVLSDVKFVPNLDLLLMNAARQRNFEIRELEGVDAYIDHERTLTAGQLDQILFNLCDLFIDPTRLQTARTLIDKYAHDLSAQPDVDTAWKKKVWFNTVALGLPAFTVAHDVDERNPLLVKGLLSAMDERSPVLVFVGAAHLGGPQGLIKLLEDQHVTVTRVR
ncbi:TraB/GumN family protein [Caenimonas terrae]|uniref:TraB/GumN family protein n=1 Tax=Caenimonas terrae TaxID=696074 RepID=A0ABW0NHP4_9BURK